MQDQDDLFTPPPAQASSPFAASWPAAYRSATSLVRYPQIGMALDHWAALWSDGGWPTRKRLDPLAMPAALEHIFLLDYDTDRSTLTYRLVGDSIRTSHDSAMKGRSLQDFVPAEHFTTVSEYFLTAVNRPALCLLTGRLYHERNRPGLGQRLLVPLFDAQARPAGLLGVTVCEHYFVSKEDAEMHSRRSLSLFPLDGSPPEHRNY